MNLFTPIYTNGRNFKVIQLWTIAESQFLAFMQEHSCCLKNCPVSTCRNYSKADSLSRSPYKNTQRDSKDYCFKTQSATTSSLASVELNQHFSCRRSYIRPGSSCIRWKDIQMTTTYHSPTSQKIVTENVENSLQIPPNLTSKSLCWNWAIFHQS